MSARFISHLLVATIAMTAVMLQIYQTVSLSPEGQILDGLIVMVSYFTFLSNALIAVVMGIAVFWPDSFARSAKWRGAMFVYIAVVALIYQSYLSVGHVTIGLDTIINMCFHSFVPVLYSIDWILFASKKGLQASDPLKWLIFPVAYIAIISISGQLTGWYPFDFLNPADAGLQTVVISILLLVFMFYIMGYAVYVIGKRHPGTV